MQGCHKLSICKKYLVTVKYNNSSIVKQGFPVVGDRGYKSVGQSSQNLYKKVHFL